MTDTSPVMTLNNNYVTNEVAFTPVLKIKKINFIINFELNINNMKECEKCKNSLHCPSLENMAKGIYKYSIKECSNGHYYHNTCVDKTTCANEQCNSTNIKIINLDMTLPKLQI
jgi:hypothetical protein